MLVARANGNGAAVRHGIARVHPEIEENLFELSGIGFDPAINGMGLCPNLKALTDDAAEQLLHIADQLVQVENLRLQELLAAEGEQLARQGGGLFARFADESRLLLDRCISLRPAADEF